MKLRNACLVPVAIAITCVACPLPNTVVYLSGDGDTGQATGDVVADGPAADRVNQDVPTSDTSDARRDAPPDTLADAPPDVATCPNNDCSNVPPPHLLAPMSTAFATTRTPTFHWQLAGGTTGAHIQFFSDPAATVPVPGGFDSTGTSGVPTQPLPAGVVFWNAYSLVGTSHGPMVSPTWELVIPAGSNSTANDSPWGTMLDFNRDGLADFAVSAPSETASNGSVQIYQGNSMRIVQPNARSLDNPGSMYANFGDTLASAGDFNGDGYGDLAVGAPSDDIGSSSGTIGHGTVYIYLGGSAQLSTNNYITVASPVLDTAIQFGAAIAGVGDVDHDGYGDLVVGAPYASTSCGPDLTGVAYIVHGSATMQAPTITMVPSPSPLANGYFGSSAANVGDVNGDGQPDFVVGEPGAATAHLYLGGMLTSPMPLVAPSGMGAVDFGVGLAGIGDGDGDGLPDFAVSDPAASNDTGFVVVYGVTHNAPAMIFQQSGGGMVRYGASVAGAGDLNGDGLGDLIVTESAGGQDYALFAFFGGSAGTFGMTSWTLEPGTNAGTGFGISIGGAGDFDGDTYADFLIGAPYYMCTPGKAYAVFGQRSTGTTPMPASFGNPATDGNFGTVVY